MLDAATIEAILQRLGRFNRFGDFIGSEITIIYSEKDLDGPAKHAIGLLRSVTDVSPAALARLVIPNEARAPRPLCLPLDVAVLDDLSLTSLSRAEYLRPAVAGYLRGFADDAEAKITFAWRADLDLALDEEMMREMIETSPITRIERAEVHAARAEKAVRTLARIFPARLVGVVANDEVRVVRLGELDPDVGETVVLPVSLGALNKGILDADWRDLALDVCPEPRFVLTQSEKGWIAHNLYTEEIEIAPTETREKLITALGITIGVDPYHLIELSSGEEAGDCIVYYARPSDAPLRDDVTGAIWRSVTDHNADVSRAAISIATSVDAAEIEQLSNAGGWHDKGKDRDCWQQAINNVDDNGAVCEPRLAKTPHHFFDGSKTQGYRHEYGSLVDMDGDDLTRHLVASHHGWARPHFKEDAGDPDLLKEVQGRISMAVMLCFVESLRLGWWRLAGLEALLKTADIAASLDGGRNE